MKANLEFDLNDVEDARRYLLHVHSEKMASTIYDIMNMKKSFEWEIENNKKMTAYKLLDLMYEKFGDIIEENEININIIQ